MKVLKNYLYNASYQVLKVLIPVITIPYLSRVLGPKGIGISSYTYSIIQYFILLSDFGINLYGNRKIAYVRDNRYKLTQTFYEIMIMQVCTVILSYCLFLLFIIFSNPFYRPYYIAQSIMIISMAFDISWFFMGIENFRITVLRNFIVRLIILAFIFVFIKSYRDLILYIILYAMSYLIGNISLFLNLKKYIDLPDVRHLHILRHIKPAILLFVPQIAIQIYSIFGKNILGLLDSSKAVGYYDQADQIGTVITGIVTATGTVMLPHVANAFSRNNVKITKKYLCDSFSIVTALSIPIAFGLSAISYKFVPLFFTYKFIIVAKLLIFESIAIIFVAWSNAIGVQYLIPTKQTISYTQSVILGSIINISLDIPFIIWLGSVGCIIVYLLSQIFVTLYQLFVLRNQISYKYLFKDFYKYILSGFIMFCTVKILDVASSVSWIMLLTEVIVGFILYLLLLLLFKANAVYIIEKLLKN